MSGWIKPVDCSRCGNPPVREKDTYWSLWRVRCPMCNRATGFRFTSKEAVVAWNVRNKAGAIEHGNHGFAVKECYNAIGALLRTIEVLEGRQKLGKPEEKGDTK